MTIYNNNLLAILKAYRSGKRGIVLEGSSRSGKSWSVIDFLFYTATQPGHSRVINIVKETYNSFKTTLYNDFNRRLPDFGFPSPFQSAKDVPSFWLLDTKVNLMGADQPSKMHGAGCDFFWMNEALPIDKAFFDQLEMRCRKFWIIDYNPNVTDHWIYELEKREDVVFFRSTFRDNPYINKWEKAKILSYEPTPDNIKAGTSDEFMWKVYGQGERAALTGLVYRNITWIDSLPDQIEDVTFGLDFGYTQNPTALLKILRHGRDIYIHPLMYEPCDDPNVIAEVIRRNNPNNTPVYADSADPGMIGQLRNRGLMVLGVKKFPGSVETGITVVKGFRLHGLRDANLQKEFNNYKYREVNGIALNEPVKEYDHYMDAMRYGIVGKWRNLL